MTLIMNVTLPVTGCLAGLLSLSGSMTASGARPNILLVVSDDHSAFAAGCYGNKDIHTPNIDRFASEGVRFSRCYASSPQSVPSRASIMTGRSPVAVNMSRFSVPLARRFVTFPEDLRRCGYYTGLAGRGYHLDGPKSGLTGKAGRIRIVADYYDEKNLVTFPDRVDTCMVVTNAQKGSTHHRTNVQFEEFMACRDKSKPFFIQLCYADPHTPYDAPEVHDPHMLTLPPYYPDTDGVRRHLAAYYDEVSRLDSDFGELLQILKDNGLEQNTIVIFTGDNGGAQFRAKGTLYDAGIHVPLIVRWPGHIKPGVCATPVSNVDISATCLDVAGINITRPIDGISLLSTIAGESPYPRYIFSERGNHGTNTLPYDTSAFDQQRCIISGDYKLIFNILPNNQYVPVDIAAYPHFMEVAELNRQGKLDKRVSKMLFSPVRPMFELYNLATDPFEFYNLIDDASLSAVRNELVRQLTYKMIDDEDFCPLPHPILYEQNKTTK